MPPIRIAFIGLSATSGWATNAHLPYLQQTDKYQIVGICNSSKKTGQAAIEKYGLPAATKAYGSPEELAHDADSFDLAVCSVRVDKHYPTIKAVAATGKPCYVEWPLGKNLAEAEELHSIAKAAGSSNLNIVGLQARRSPIVNKIKSLLSSNTIGKVLSVNVQSSAGNLGQIESAAIGRLFEVEGASMLTIHFGHMIDYVLYALGQDLKSLSASLSTQRPVIQLKHPDGSLEDFEKSTPDQILLHGQLSGGGVISVHQRGGAPFNGAPGLVWRIYGENGEIIATSKGSFLQIGYGDNMHIRVHYHEKDETEDVEWKREDEFEKLPQSAQNVASIYEAFRNGKGKNGEYANWDEALARHKLLEAVVESSKSGSTVHL